jgi:hypothetical protein
MRAFAFWKAVIVDQANLLERFFSLLSVHRIPFCLIGGQGLNAYVEPVVSLDLDIVIAADRIDDAERLLRKQFTLERFSHSLNVSDAASDLRIQIQLDPRYAPFIERAGTRSVLGLNVPVAAIDDILRGKIWAVTDMSRRGSKRQKDLADIARIVECYPDLRSTVPPDVLSRLM